jgi:hypothetical protein
MIVFQGLGAGSMCVVSASGSREGEMGSPTTSPPSKKGYGTVRGSLHKKGHPSNLSRPEKYHAAKPFVIFLPNPPIPDLARF